MAKKLSKEIQTGMKDDSFKILENIWGDTPKIWNSDLKGYKRSRTIINYYRGSSIKSSLVVDSF